MKILVTGINGQVGWELMRQGELGGFKIFGCGRNDLDIADRQAVARRMMDCRPGLVINCAAYTAVDKAETEPEIAYAVNRDGPGLLAESCAALGVPLIHLSTDYVFNGQADRPYKESDSINPLGVYGISKEEGEQRVREVLKQHLIIRTSWVYGVHGKNFVKTMLMLGAEREEIRVVNDQWGCPTFAGDLAEALLTIAGKIRNGDDVSWGTYHYCGTTVTTWHGFASMLFEQASGVKKLKVKSVVPVPSSAFPTPARRPMYSVLDCSKLCSAFGVRTHSLKSGIEKMLSAVIF